MKNLFTVLMIVMLVFSAAAQDFKDMDASPMDAAYFPDRAAFRAFAKTEEEKKANEPKIRVIYSRPQKRERDVFGGLLKYGEVWRVGANEATEITFLQDVTIGDAKVSKGRYTIYAIPQESEWEVHFSNDNDRWGQYAYKPDESLVTKITVPTAKTSSTVEAFSIVFEAVEGGTHMVMGWDDTMVRVPIML